VKPLDHDLFSIAHWRCARISSRASSASVQILSSAPDVSRLATISSPLRGEYLTRR